MTLGRELSSLQTGVFQAAIPERSWLNSPLRMRRANDKIWQQGIARSIGFDTPPTVVTNKWSTVKKLTKPVIMKMVIGQVFAADQSKLLYSTLLDDEKLALVAHASPFPGIFQTYLEKAREWRVTMVAAKAFPVAIYTTGPAKTDWRNHNLPGDLVRYVHEPAPPEIVKKCRAYMRAVGLRYGAFDLIEGPDSTITFLEMNTNGQFRGLETKTTGLKISAAIADKLVALARSP